jgi:hypothetical protein
MSKKIHKGRCTQCGSLIRSDGKTPAERMYDAFGNAKRLAVLCGLDIVSVYRWNYPKEKGGTGGNIPHGNFEKILAAAKANKIKITKSDLV